MVNYLVDDFKTEVADMATVLAALETELETRDSAKTIRHLDVIQVGSGSFQGILIIDT